MSIRMPFVSVIVPVFNVAPFLEKCVDSLLAQTLDNIEIILVDDGSTDESPRICDSYAAVHAHVSAIHKPNGGASSARNAGMECARGSYVGFVDGDDCCAPTMFETLYSGALDSDADMAVCGIFNQIGERIAPHCAKKLVFVCSAEEAFGHSLVGDLVPGSVCNRIIRKSCIGSLEFPVGKIYEDAAFTNLLITSVGSVFVTTEPLYYYIHRMGSITTVSFSEKNLDVIGVYEESMRIVEENYPSLMPQAQFRLCWAYFTVLDKLLMTSNYREQPVYLPILSYLRSHIVDIIRSKYFKKTRKIAALALGINVLIYRALLVKNQKRIWRDL